MRRRLALLSLAVASLVVIAFVVPLAVSLRNQARNRALLAAERDANVVATTLAVAAVTDTDRGVVITKELAAAVVAAYETRTEVSVIFTDGTVLGVPVDITPEIERVRTTGRGLSIPVEGGIAIHVPVLSSSAPAQVSTVVVRKFVSDEELWQGVVPAWLMIGGLGIFLIVFAVVAADRLGRSIMQPVGELVDAARTLGAGDLETRVDIEGPLELAEVGEAFNYLAGQLDALLAAERESVADLSHRLRTPLTALRLQAETMADTEGGASLLADVDRMEEAVNRMINQARSPSSTPPDQPLQSDLAAVVRHRATFWKVLADEQQRPASVHTTGGSLNVGLPAEELGAVVDTLLANVFAYTESGVGYEISAAPGVLGQVVLTVADDGPGFDDTSVLERGASGGGSTGLGLDIARRAAERTGGRLEIGNRPSGGAVIRVVFGRQAPMKQPRSVAPRPRRTAPAEQVDTTPAAEPTPDPAPSAGE